MPNRDTFSIKPIGDFVWKYLMESSVSIDPFSRNKRWATYTNDLDPDTAAESHMECEDFLQWFIDERLKADLFIMDPPYSPRQVKECYNSIGRKMEREDAWGSAARKRRRRLIEQISTPGAVVLSFGWNTTGMGPGWEIEEIMLCAHGSDHNDTICMAERKLART